VVLGELKRTRNHLDIRANTHIFERQFANPFTFINKIILHMIHEAVIKHYAWKKQISLEDSEILHLKLFEFLNEAVNSKCALQPSREIDEVWHNFILHTKLYAEFCKTTYNRFIHHNPKIPNAISPNKADCDTEDEKCDVGVSQAFGQFVLADCDGGGDNCDSQVVNYEEYKS